MDLNTIYFAVLLLLIAIYCVLDGFDLGLGILYGLTFKRQNRDHLITLVGPYWDGNEVWLLGVGVVLFAAFPAVYATFFSALYIPVLLLAILLIFRAIAIDLRYKYPDSGWCGVLDFLFFLASLLIVVVLGVAGANLATGFHSDANGVIRVGLFECLAPPRLLGGLLAAGIITLHGSTYALCRDPGDMFNFLKKSAVIAWALTVLIAIPAIRFNINLSGTYAAAHPTAGFAVSALLLLSFFSVLIFILSEKRLQAFLSSAVSLAAALSLLGMINYPRLIPVAGNDGASLTIYNSAAGPATLKVLLILIAVGLPFIIGYTVFAYKILAVTRQTPR